MILFFLFLLFCFPFYHDSGHGKLFSSPMPRSLPFSLPWLPLFPQFGAWETFFFSHAPLFSFFSSLASSFITIRGMGDFFLLPCPALFLFLFFCFLFYHDSGHGILFSSPMPRSFPFFLPWLPLLHQFGAWVTFFFSHAPSVLIGTTGITGPTGTTGSPHSHQISALTPATR